MALTFYTVNQSRLIQIWTVFDFAIDVVVVVVVLLLDEPNTIYYGSKTIPTP